MKDSLKIIIPHGAMGASNNDDFIDTGLRQIAIYASPDAKLEWAEKYGTNYENDVFMMHRYCWCENDNCKWCNGDEPNFRHKKSGLEITWYKYIGRGVERNMKVKSTDWSKIIIECIESIKK